MLFAGSGLAAPAQPYTIGTLAGSATNPGNADGTNGAAQFTSPTGLALDSNGNILLNDGNAIRRIVAYGTNWVLGTLAGAILTHGPNDGTNSAAQFDDPQGLAVDAAGNIYVADTLNNAIRKVTPIGTNWVVTTIAGLAGRSNFGTADGTNAAARFHNPFGIALDSATNLYVTDTLNATIRKLTPIGTNWVVTTLAGLTNNPGSANGSNSVARFNNPTGIAMDTAGNVYVTDFGNNSIRKVMAIGTNWAVTTLAGLAGSSGSADGLGSAARFNLPQCIAVDGAQNLFVTDSGNYTLRKVTPTGLVSTLAGTPGVSGTANGTGKAALFSEPYGIAVNGAGTLYVADYLGYSVRQGRLAPLLQLAVSGQRFVLSWPLGLTGFVAEVCTSLPGASWSALPTNGILLTNQYFFLTNNLGPGPGFFRLHKLTP